MNDLDYFVLRRRDHHSCDEGGSDGAVACAAQQQHTQEAPGTLLGLSGVDPWRPGGNLTQAEAMLRGRNVPCNRRWLAVFLDRWGIRPMQRRGE